MDCNKHNTKNLQSSIAADGGARSSRSRCEVGAYRQGPFAYAGRIGTRAQASGFTYIGVLVLIALMGISLVLASELWHTAQKREKERELLFVGNQFRHAMEMYNAAGGGYPQRLEDLVKDPRVPGVRRFLRKIYRDPITGTGEWGLVRSADRAIFGVYSLSEAQPIKQAEFSLANQDFKGKMKYSEWVFLPTIVPGRSSSASPPGSSATPNVGVPDVALSRVRR